MTIRETLEQNLKDLDIKYSELEKEWDRLDSTGQSERQRKISIDMSKLAKKIKDLKIVLGE